MLDRRGHDAALGRRLIPKKNGAGHLVPELDRLRTEDRFVLLRDVLDGFESQVDPKDPRARYADAKAFADDLRRWLEGEPIQARRLGLGERLVRLARRRPAAVLAVGLAVLALGLGGAAGVVTWLWQRAADGAPPG